MQQSIDQYSNMIPHIMKNHLLTCPTDTNKFCVLLGVQVVSSFGTEQEALDMQADCAAHHVGVTVVFPLAAAKATAAAAVASAK